MEPTVPAPQAPVTPEPQAPVQPPMPQPEQPAAPDAIPQTWPGIFGVYKYSKAAIRFNLGTNVWLIVLVGILSGASEAGSRDGHNAFAGLIGYFLGTLFGAALILSQIAGVRRTKLSFEAALKKALPLWVKYILLSLLVNITYIISFLLLVVPFFFVLPRLTLATYFLVDCQMGIMEAYKASWHATKGHIAEPWNVIAGTVLICLLCLTIIGIPFSIYFYIMYSAALAVYYEMRLKSAGTPDQVAQSSQPIQQPPVPPVA